MSMVRKDALSQELLDFRAHDLEFLNEIKKDLSEMFNKNGDLKQTFEEKHDIDIIRDTKKEIINEISLKTKHKSLNFYLYI